MARKSLNKVILSGNLGKAPIIRTTQDGTKVATTSLAVNDSKGGTSWANLVAFGKPAELMEQYLDKGSGIIVVGRYRVREYTVNEETRLQHEIVVEDITFMGGDRRQNTADADATDTTGDTPTTSPAATTKGAPAPTPIRKAVAADDDLFTNGDIPF